MSRNDYSVVFDAEDSTPRAGQSQLRPDDLSFQDFSSSAIPADASGRLSPSGQGNARASSPGGLYGPDIEMQRQIGGQAPGGGMWSVEAYQSLFDVDTVTVLERSWKTMYPRDDYVETVLEGRVDLYGPFWVPTTLIFVLFVATSLSSSIAAYLADHPYKYDFTRLSVGVSLVYGYTLAFPVILWATLRYWARVEARSPVEIISLYGYNTTVWIIAAILSIPPVSFFRSIFALVSLSLSLGFLLRNFYPLLRAGGIASDYEADTAKTKAARALVLIGIAVAHVIFSAFMWWGFLGGESFALPADGTVPDGSVPGTTPVPTDVA